MHRLVTAHDVGTIINPLDHQGQIDGAVMQGLGYALMEGLQEEGASPHSVWVRRRSPRCKTSPP